MDGTSPRNDAVPGQLAHSNWLPNVNEWLPPWRSTCLTTWTVS